MLYFYKKFIRSSMLLMVLGAATKAVASEISKGVALSPRNVLSKKAAASENIGKPRVVRKNGQTTEVFRAKTDPKKTVSAVPQFAPGLSRWPTDNRAFFDNKPLADYIQPTQSGRLVSGLWGCTRNQGKKFHAGADMKSLYRDRRYVPQDCIFAALPGKVAYINTNPKNSAYGNYVVLEHFDPNLRFYTLYAHLASVEPTLKIGQSVEQNTLLGVMGCTGNGRVCTMRMRILKSVYQSERNKPSRIGIIYKNQNPRISMCTGNGMVQIWFLWIRWNFSEPKVTLRIF